jgi:hypothetical protein
MWGQDDPGEPRGHWWSRRWSERRDPFSPLEQNLDAPHYSWGPPLALGGAAGLGVMLAKGGFPVSAWMLLGGLVGITPLAQVAAWCQWRLKHERHWVGIEALRYWGKWMVTLAVVAVGAYFVTTQFVRVFPLGVGSS